MAGEIYVQIVVDMADDEKIRALARYGRAARGCRDLYVQMVLYCRRKLTDGYIPIEQLGVLVYPDQPKVGEQDAARLIAVGLAESREGGYWLPGYLKRNPSRAQVEAGMAAKIAGAALANHRRWHVAKGRYEPACEHCTESLDGQSGVSPPIGGLTGKRPSTDGALTDDRERSESTETETETETRTKDSSASAPPKRGTDDDPDFAEFWAVYPLKKDKGHARTAWRTAIDKRRADPKALVKAAQQYRDDPSRKPDYTAYAATWLTGERYNDAPADVGRLSDAPWNA